MNLINGGIVVEDGARPGKGPRRSPFTRPAKPSGVQPDCTNRRVRVTVSVERVAARPAPPMARHDLPVRVRNDGPPT